MARGTMQLDDHDGTTVAAGTGTAGGRRGWWIAVAGAAAVAVLAVLAGTALGRQQATGSVPPSAAAPASKPPVSVAPVDGRLGAVVDTGLPATGGTTWVLFFVPMDWPDAPWVTMTLAIGERDARGTIVDALSLAVDVEKDTERAAGFHPMQAPMQLEHGVVQPSFGYYVGRPARITAVFDGLTTVDAHLAPWSADPDVTIFWFDPAAGAVEEISNLGAFDAAGGRLPDGLIRAGYF